MIDSWGVALGKVPGNKQKAGDMRTPEGSFSVQQIQDARSWTHDFKDGKGVIKTLTARGSSALRPDGAASASTVRTIPNRSVR